MRAVSEVMDRMAEEKRALWRVEPCDDCGSMKPLGAKYHAPLMRTVDVNNPVHPRCKHGVPYYRTCRRVVPPPCCWNDRIAGPTGATPRAGAQARLDAFMEKQR